jgi:hypothetical protein
MGEQLQRGLVRPVHVVEHQQAGTPLGKDFEHGAHCVVGAVALVLERRGRRFGQLREGREHGRQLAHLVVSETAQQRGIDAPQIRIERIDEDTERNFALELRGPPGEDVVLALVGARRDLRHQARLADPRLAHHLKHRRSARFEPIQRSLQERKLGSATNELPARINHRPQCPVPGVRRQIEGFPPML